MGRHRAVGTCLGVLVAALVARPTLAGAEGSAVIEEIQPTSGPPDTVVQVIGRRLGQHGKVRVGSVELQLVRTLPNRITVRVPEGAASGRIVVETGSGEVRGPEFRVTARPPAPVIEGVEPAAAPPGSQVTIRGRNFSARLTGNVVMLGDRPVVVRSATPVALEVIVPSGATSAPFDVRVSAAGEARSSPFEVTAATAIHSIEPAAGVPGARVTLHGVGFSATAADNRVYLNNQRLKVVGASAAALVVELPRDAASGELLVDVVGGGRATAPGALRVQRPPSVVAFAPSKGVPGTLVTVRGTNFGTDPAAVEVHMGDSTLAVREAAQTRLVVEIPEGAASDRLSIRVNGVGPAWSSVAFRVLQSLAIRSFAPQSGPAGTVVTIRGAGFDTRRTRNEVSVGGQPALVIEATEGELEVRIPAGKSGPIRIRVGAAQVGTTDPFVVTVPPEVQAVEPVQGTVGSELRIRGRGFGLHVGMVRVSLGGQPLEVRSVRDDLLVARVTPGAKTGAIEVATPLQGAGRAPHEFTVLPHLMVLGLEPARAPAGAAVTLRGQGFLPRGTVVDFAGSAVEPETISDDQLVVRVPPDARPGIVTVRLADGRSAPSPSAFEPVAEPVPGG